MTKYHRTSQGAIARPPWQRLLMIFHGVAFHRELVTQSTIANGLYRRADKGTGYNEHYLRLTSARRQLENMHSWNGWIHEMFLDVPLHSTYNEIMLL